MKLMPLGDYYAWNCEWCDSYNRILWTRIDEGKVVCGVCYTTFPILPSDARDDGSSMQAA